MPKKRTGTLATFRKNDGQRYFRGRLRLGDGSRQWVDVPPEMSEARAREWLASQQEREDRLGLLLRQRLAAKGATVDGETFETWVGRWLDDRHRKGLSAADTDAGRMKCHVTPILGPKAMPAITSHDVEDVRDALDAKARAEEISTKTAKNVWGLVTKAFADACNSKNRGLRVLRENPALGIAPPDKGAKPSKQYLYPDELQSLLACALVPFSRRELYALAVYTYMRAAELKALDWADADLERGVLHVHKQVDRRTGKERETKSGQTRRLPIEPNLLPLLNSMRKAAAGDRVISGLSETDRKLARRFRADLVLAGVTREALHKAKATRKAITFHDLRATGITWCAARGDDPLKIKQRAGHSTFSTTEGYIREAENLRESLGAVFGPINLWDKEQPQSVSSARNNSGGAGNRKRRTSTGGRDSSPIVDGDRLVRLRSIADNPAIVGRIGLSNGPTVATGRPLVAGVALRREVAS